MVVDFIFIVFSFQVQPEAAGGASPRCFKAVVNVVSHSFKSSIQMVEMLRRRSLLLSLTLAEGGFNVGCTWHIIRFNKILSSFGDSLNRIIEFFLF